MLYSIYTRSVVGILTRLVLIEALFRPLNSPLAHFLFGHPTILRGKIKDTWYSILIVLLIVRTGSIENQKWRVKIGDREYLFFGSIVGSSFCLGTEHLLLSY